MSELKPCPFCGGEAEFKEGRQREDGMWKSGYVTCKDCGIPTAYSLSPTLFFGTTRNGWLTDKECHECSLTSIEAWNTRAEHTCEGCKHEGKISLGEPCYSCTHINYNDCYEKDTREESGKRLSDLFGILSEKVVKE